MSFFKTKTKKEDLEQGGSGFINKSGMYEVEVITCLVDTGKGGSVAINPFVDHQGSKQVVYGNMRITNNDGKENEIGSKVFNQLLVIAELDEIEEPEDMDMPVGKKGADKEVSVLTDIDSVPVFMRIQMEHTKYNGKIRSTPVIKGFYRGSDKASAQEVVNGDIESVGTQYEKDMKYVDNVTYKDGVTAEEVAAQSFGGGSSDSAPATKKPTFKPKKSFKK